MGYLIGVDSGGTFTDVVIMNEERHIYFDKALSVPNYALIREQPLGKAGPWICRRWRGNSPNFVLVEYICPDCGVLFSTEERLKCSILIQH